jgi:hypothetical protein
MPALTRFGKARRILPTSIEFALAQERLIASLPPTLQARIDAESPAYPPVVQNPVREPRRGQAYPIPADPYPIPRRRGEA